MRREIKNFLIYSLRYQLLLARRISDQFNTKVYVFDTNGYFDHDTTFELVDDVNTVVKENKRAVLSTAVNESFGDNYNLFLEFVDPGTLEQDDIGLFVPAILQTKEQVEDLEEKHAKVVDVDVDEVEEVVEEVVIDVDDVDEQVEQLNLNK